MGRHDRPLERPGVEEIVETAAQQAIAEPAARSYHSSPRCRAAMRRPRNVRSGSVSLDRLRQWRHDSREASRRHDSRLLATGPFGDAPPDDPVDRIGGPEQDTGLDAFLRAPPDHAIGSLSSVAGSLAARRVSWSADVLRPGMIAPPRKRASAVTQSKVVAVPKSTTMASA